MPVPFPSFPLVSLGWAHTYSGNAPSPFLDVGLKRVNKDVFSSDGYTRVDLTPIQYLAQTLPPGISVSPGIRQVSYLPLITIHALQSRFHWTRWIRFRVLHPILLDRVLEVVNWVPQPPSLPFPSLPFVSISRLKRRKFHGPHSYGKIPNLAKLEKTQSIALL